MNLGWNSKEEITSPPPCFIIQGVLNYWDLLLYTSLNDKTFHLASLPPANVWPIHPTFQHLCRWWCLIMWHRKSPNGKSFIKRSLIQWKGIFFYYLLIHKRYNEFAGAVIQNGDFSFIFAPIHTHPYSLNFCYSSPWFYVVSVVSLHWNNTDVV